MSFIIVDKRRCVAAAVGGHLDIAADGRTDRSLLGLPAVLPADRQDVGHEDARAGRACCAEPSGASG